VGGNGSGAFETAWVVDSSFERQRGDKANARRGHQSLTDGVSMSEFTGPVIQFTEGTRK
jgi:hypothetical protein